MPRDLEARQRMAGFSLVELLIALLLMTLISLSFFAAVWQFQKGNSDLHGRLERDEQLRLSPLLLTRYLSGAGSRRWSGGWEGLKVLDHRIEARSDSSGPRGFPDGELEERFESVALRRRGNDLQLRSGAGSFQPLLSHIRGFSARRPSGPVMTIRLTAATRRNLQHGKTGRRETELQLPLYNYRPNLFAEAEQ